MSIPIITQSEQKTVHQIVAETYFNSQTGRKPTESDISAIAEIHDSVLALGTVIESVLPPGRNKSLAKTALEDVQMRAVRAIFSPIG